MPLPREIPTRGGSHEEIQWRTKSAGSGPGRAALFSPAISPWREPDAADVLLVANIFVLHEQYEHHAIRSLRQWIKCLHVEKRQPWGRDPPILKLEKDNVDLISSQYTSKHCSGGEIVPTQVRTRMI